MLVQEDMFYREIASTPSQKETDVRIDGILMAMSIALAALVYA